MCKHRGGFPEGQSPIVLDSDTLSNAEYNIKYLKTKQFTIYYSSMLMNIHLCTNVIKSIFYLLYPTKSRDIVIIHMSDYQVTIVLR